MYTICKIALPEISRITTSKPYKGHALSCTRPHKVLKGYRLGVVRHHYQRDHETGSHGEQVGVAMWVNSFSTLCLSCCADVLYSYNTHVVRFHLLSKQ